MSKQLLCSHGETGKCVHENHNAFLDHRHEELDPRIRVRSGEVADAGEVREDAVEQTHRDEGKCCSHSEVNAFLAARRVAQVGSGDDGHAEEEDVDDDEYGDPDLSVCLAGGMLRDVAGSFVSTADDTQDQRDHGGQLRDLDDAAASGDGGGALGDDVSDATLGYEARHRGVAVGILAGGDGFGDFIGTVIEMSEDCQH